MPLYTCEKCGKAMNETQFYTYKNSDKTELCKKCMTMHIDNYDPETFLWLLEKMDVPYVETEWNVLRDRAYEKAPKGMNGMSVFGKYLSKMKLRQWMNYTWADTEKLKAEMEDRKIQHEKEQAERDAFIREQFESGGISEAEYRTRSSATAQKQKDEEEPYNPYLGPDNPYQEKFFINENDLPDPAAELTQEDKVYLAMKWGRLYKPGEWVELERKYNEMMASFDIQDADTINTLILLCKTNLKMNQMLDNGDIEGYQKLSKVSESLRKTAKFTAAQNKEQKSDYVDSIGELVAMCEKEGGFIPRFCTDIPLDKVDTTLRDMNNFIYKLVTQDLGFGSQIEDAIKKFEIQKEMNANSNKNLDDDSYDELENEDYEAFYEEIEKQKEADLDSYNEDLEEE